MSKTVAVIFFISLVIFSARASAQENEVSLSLGGTFTPGSHTFQEFFPAFCTFTNPNCISIVDRNHINSQISYEGVFARRVIQTRVASFHVELPVLGIPSRTLGSSAFIIPGFGAASTRRDFSSVFITPSFRAKFLPDAIVSPFASVGVGIAHFTAHTSGLVFHTDGTSATINNRDISNTTLAEQFGVGLDFKTPIRYLGFRLEVRDFLAERPRLDFGPDDHHNNIFAGAGVVFHF